MITFELDVRRGDFRLAASAELSSTFTGVWGPSGSGKSTLLAALAGLVPPERARIVVDDEVLANTDERIVLPPHRRGIGVVFQDGRLFPHLSVRGNLVYGARAGSASIALGFDEMVELLALGPLLDRKPLELSGGERQRVALGRALLAATRLLLLDEPLSALDREMRGQILPYLSRVRERVDVPVLYVSHDLSEILQLTDQLLLMRGGETVENGSLLELVRAGHVLHGELDNVLELEVEEQDEEAGLSILRMTPSTAIAGAFVPSPLGARLHVGLRPEDVMLAREHVSAISARNQVAGSVSGLIEEGRRVLAVVDCGIELFVEVSPSAVAELDLVPGREVVCLFKANALRYLDAPLRTGSR